MMKEVVIKFRVKPNANKNRIVGRYGDGYKVEVSAPPERGKANVELIRFLSDLLSVKKSAIEIISGETSRDKLIKVYGLEERKITKILD